MTDSATQPVMDEAAASEFLWNECGVKIARATLRKLRCVGGGPPFFKGFGGRVFYEREPSKAWAAKQRGPLVNSTSELRHCVANAALRSKRPISDD